MRAMILLGINGGFGNADCGTLPLTAVDLERGLIDYPRPPRGGTAVTGKMGHVTFPYPADTFVITVPRSVIGNPPDGSLLEDFRIMQEEHAIHVLNAPSPAATASLCIGEQIAGLIDA